MKITFVTTTIIAIIVIRILARWPIITHERRNKRKLGTTIIKLLGICGKVCEVYGFCPRCLI